MNEMFSQKSNDGTTNNRLKLSNFEANRRHMKRKFTDQPIRTKTVFIGYQNRFTFIYLTALKSKYRIFNQGIELLDKFMPNRKHPEITIRTEIRVKVKG